MLRITLGTRLEKKDVPNHPGMGSKEPRLFHPPYRIALLLRYSLGILRGIETARFNTQPRCRLRHNEKQAEVIIPGIEKILMEKKPEIVLFQGDMNMILGVALAASKLHIKVGHVEASPCYDDRRMPEEINRIFADHISDVFIPPTKKSVKYKKASYSVAL